MIIGVEAKDKQLLISYYDENGKIAYMKKPILDYEMFNWGPSDKPSLYKNWDGANIKSVPSDQRWLTRTRLEELLLDKLSVEERELIYNFNNHPKKDYLDIEIKLTDDTFPAPEKAEMPVGLISFCDESGNNYVLSNMTSDEHPNGLSDSEIVKMEAEINEHFRSIVPHDKKDKKLFDINFTVKHKFFATEKDLLEFFFHKIIPRMSFMTGWNVIDFDWQYLMNRCSRIGVDSLAMMTSRKTFTKRYKLPTHLGILDYMALFQDPSFKPWKVVENYTLDYISHRALNVKKLEHPYPNMMEFQKDVYMFTKYNIIDNILVKLIDDKFGLLDVAFSLANVAEIEVNKISSPVHVTEVLMCREFLNMNRKMMKKPYQDSDEDEDEKYEGAYVMPPIPGFYEYILCYDFKSLYPNLQMQFNISPDSYLGKIGMVRRTGKEIWTRNDTLFSGEKDSVARTILSRLYNARVDTQEEIKKLKFS